MTQRSAQLLDRGVVAVPSTDDAPDQAFDFRGPWLSVEQACNFIPCKSRKALADWCRYRGVIRRANGSVAKRDLDRVLRRKRRVMHANSLANLRKRLG